MFRGSHRRKPKSTPKSAPAAAVAQARPPVEHKHHPNSMRSMSGEKLVDILREKARNILLINAREEKDDAWFRPVKRLALQNEMIYLADAMREFMGRHPHYRNKLQQATWEELRNIQKHYTESIPEEKLFEFAKQLGSVVYATLTNMTHVDAPNKPVLDQKQLERLTPLVNFSDSKSNSLYTIMGGYLAAFTPEKSELNDKEFFTRIKNQIIPLINVFAERLFAETDADALPVEETDRFMWLAAVRELLKECGKLYTPERLERFESAEQPFDFVDRGGWDEVKKFLMIVKKTICNKVGHEIPEAISENNIKMACGLAKKINPAKCKKPGDIDLIYPKAEATIQASPAAFFDVKGSGKPVSMHDEKAKVSTQASASAAIPAAPPGGAAFTHDVTTKVSVSEEKSKSAAAASSAALVNAQLDEKDDEPTENPRQKTASEFLQEIDHITNDFSNVKPEYQLRARVVRCLCRYAALSGDLAENSKIRDNFFSILQKLKNEFSAINNIRKTLKKEKRIEKKAESQCVSVSANLNTHLNNIDKHIEDLTKIKAQLKNAFSVLTWPRDDISFEAVDNPCLLTAEGMADFLFDVNTMLKYFQSKQQKHPDDPTKYKHPFSPRTKISLSNVQNIEKPEQLIKSIRKAPINYVDNLESCWKLSRPKLLKQFDTSEAEVKVQTATSFSVSAGVAVAPTPPSAPLMTASNAAFDDKKSDVEILSDEKIIALSGSVKNWEGAAKFIEKLQANPPTSDNIKTWCKKNKNLLKSHFDPTFIQIMTCLLNHNLWEPNNLDKLKQRIAVVKAQIDKLKTTNSTQSVVLPSPNATSLVADDKSAAAAGVDKNAVSLSGEAPILNKRARKKQEENAKRILSAKQEIIDRLIRLWNSLSVGLVLVTDRKSLSDFVLFFNERSSSIESNWKEKVLEIIRDMTQNIKNKKSPAGKSMYEKIVHLQADIINAQKILSSAGASEVKHAAAAASPVALNEEKVVDAESSTPPSLPYLNLLSSDQLPNCEDKGLVAIVPLRGIPYYAKVFKDGSVDVCDTKQVKNKFKLAGIKSIEDSASVVSVIKGTLEVIDKNEVDEHKNKIKVFDVTPKEDNTGVSVVTVSKTVSFYEGIPKEGVLPSALVNLDEKDDRLIFVKELNSWFAYTYNFALKQRNAFFINDEYRKPTRLSSSLVAFAGRNEIGVLKIKTTELSVTKISNPESKSEGFQIFDLIYSEKHSRLIAVSGTPSSNKYCNTWKVVNDALVEDAVMVFDNSPSHTEDISSLVNLPSGYIASLGKGKNESLVSIWNILNKKKPLVASNLMPFAFNRLAWLGDGYMAAYSDEVGASPGVVFDLPNERKCEQGYKLKIANPAAQNPAAPIAADGKSAVAPNKVVNHYARFFQRNLHEFDNVVALPPEEKSSHRAADHLRLSQAAGMDNSKVSLEKFNKIIDKCVDSERAMAQALYTAIRNDCYDKAELLFERGARFDVLSEAGVTPLESLTSKTSMGNQGAIAFSAIIREAAMANALLAK